MVFLNVTESQAMKWRRIDPHFRPTKAALKPTEAPGPAARFPATLEGWEDAIQYAQRRLLGNHLLIIKIMRKIITVVGVGALGSHLVQLIRNLDVEIRVIDFDRVEQKNTLSQFHPKSSSSKLKVEALRQTMGFLWGTKLTSISSKIVKENVKELLASSNLIVDCLDNGDARRLVQAYVRENTIPVFMEHWRPTVPLEG